MKKIYIIFVPAVIIIILIATSFFLSVKRIYRSEVLQKLKSESSEQDVITKADIEFLPLPVQRYLKYVGVVGKKKVSNARIFFDGVFKLNPKQNWMTIETEQYDFFKNPTRIFYIKGSMFGIPIDGRDLYSDGNGNMIIKAASLITIANAKGVKIDIGEMIALFNDMCLLAPAALIDKRIHWQNIDSLTVKGSFEDNGKKVSAILFFNENGELINFVTDDRYYSPTGGTYVKAKWSTPVKYYKEVGGIKVPAEGETIWHFTDGDFCYAKFKLIEIEYNCEEFK